MDRRRAIGFLLVLVSACSFGSGGLFAQPVYAAGVDWLVLSAWRFGIGAVLAWLWVLAWPDTRRGLRLLDRRTAAIAVALGVLYTGNSGTYYAGLEEVPVSLASLLVYIYPALVAVIALRVGRRLEGRRPWFALGLALIGVALAVGGIPQGSMPPLGALTLVLASSIIYAVWVVLSARLGGERRDALGGERKDVLGRDAAEGSDAAAVTALMISGTAVTYWLGALATGAAVLPDRIPTAAWPGLIGVGLIATFVSIQTFYAGTRLIGAAQAALVSTTEPIWTIALAALLFGQTLGPTQLLGGAFIIIGVLIAQAPPQAFSAIRPGIRLADE